MSILLLSTGGGGGNILRSLKTLFDHDVEITRKTDPEYAARLRSAITTLFLDTNEFSLSDLPVEEQLVIGTRTTGRLGARHNPDVARQALEESREDVEAVLRGHSVVILIGTGGKGTGAGTIFPLAEMARRFRKLVLPIFVRPSFERHEVDKRRYDHALRVGEQFDAAGIRLIEILNDRGYDEAAPKPQLVVWERMNLPIARGLRGLIHVLWDLCQVDPSDLSMLFAGHGRLRIGFGEIEGSFEMDPCDEHIDRAVRGCWDNPYYAFGRPAGTSLVCIHGEWSNVVDAKIKSRLAEAAVAGAGSGPYNPLYTRAVQSPRPWGVTALFGEFTGVHAPLDIDWAFGRREAPAVVRRPAVTVIDGPADQPPPVASLRDATSSAGRRSAEARRLMARAKAEAGHDVPEATVLREVIEPSASPATTAVVSASAAVEMPRIVVRRQPESRMPSGFWEFAVAVNRAESSALALAANGDTAELPIDGLEVKKLLGTMWFRTILPRFSERWRARILDALVNDVALPNHVMRVNRRTVPLSELDCDQLQEVAAKSWVPDVARADLELLAAVGRLWGREAIKRFQFGPAPERKESSIFASLLGGYGR
jgi:cell division GTPase FtsZ